VEQKEHEEEDEELAVRERVNSGCRSVIQARLKSNSSKLDQQERIQLEIVHKDGSRLEEPTQERSAATRNTKIRQHQRSNLHILHPPPVKLSMDIKLSSRAAHKHSMIHQQ
jgi:aspartate carbamoyltransferase catalytic subunit